MNRSRPIIVHAHLFKNAGTTIDWILEKNFKHRFHEDRQDKRMRNEPTYMREVLDGKPELCAISSHSIPLPLTPIEGYRFYTLLMLRDPILRVRSVYDFERMQKSDTPGAVNAKKLSFKEYVNWRMDPNVAPTIRNFQVGYLTGNKALNHNISATDRLSKAMKFVETTTTVGVVEDFDKSMSVFGKALSEDFPNLDFSYQAQNITRKEPKTRGEIVAHIRKELGDELFLTLEKNNSLDIALYNRYLEILEHR